VIKFYIVITEENVKNECCREVRSGEAGGWIGKKYEAK